MTDPTPFPITVRSNERWDRRFQCQNSDGSPFPLTGWTAVMIISDGEDVLFTSAGEPADIVLTQEAAGAIGAIDVLLGQDLTGSLLMPFGGAPDYWYRLDLVDNGDSTNVIHLMLGTVTVESRYGA